MALPASSGGNGPGVEGGATGSGGVRSGGAASGGAGGLSDGTVRGGGTLSAIEGDADRFLAAGLYGYQLANAAEILRYTYPAWGAERIERFQRMLVEIFYALSHEFLTTYAGSRVDHHFANCPVQNL